MEKFNWKRIAVIVVVMILIGVGVYLYSTDQLPFTLPTVNAAAMNTASGFIAGDDVNVVAEIGGRITAINVREGDTVTAGQTLIELDPTLLNAQIAQAQAAVDTAQAQLKMLTDGPRAADVAAAQGALDAAKQSYAKLQAGATESDVAAAKAIRAAAQQNYAKVRAGPTTNQLSALQAQMENAQAALDQAQAAYDRIGGASNPQIGLTPQAVQLQMATNNYGAALAAYDDARTHPTAAELTAAAAQVQQAQAALDHLTPDVAQLAVAQSQVQQAQAVLARLTPTQDSIDVAQSQVKQAESALAVLQAEAAKLTLMSPVTGIVTHRAFQAAELASPGAALLTITQLDTVTLTVFLPETYLGRIRLGQQVAVQVDSFPGRNFTGKVTFINSQAEFTPRNVQTKEQRVNTVFAIKVELANGSQELKPGMPADAVIE